MNTIRIPSPLRPYADGLRELEVQGEDVNRALLDLTRRYPALYTHLFSESGELRPYVNVFVNDEDVRQLQGPQTPLKGGDRLILVPSIAGGASDLQPVDHAALRTNQALIIALLGAAFVADAPWVAALVAGVLALGTLVGRPGFLPVYLVLRRVGWFKPDVLSDHPAPHRFAQAFGAVVLVTATGSFLTGLSALGWSLSLLVAALAALNLFAGLCLGCALYYWLSRLGIPGFHASPPPGTSPGRRPSSHR